MVPYTRSMGQYLLRRLVLLVPTFFGITLVAFILLSLAPGDPARMLAGQDADPATIQAIRDELGLDRPLPVQYLGFVADAVRADLGRSYVTRRPVSEEIARRYPRTFTLAVASVSIAFLLGVLLGVVAAIKPNSWLDNSTQLLAMTSLSVPGYALALVLIFIFAVRLRLLPTVGLDRPEALLLPTLSLALYPMAYIARVTRAGMLEVVESDFIRTARAKGLAERPVFLRHALRNALLPVATATGLTFAHALGGTVIIEQIFAINGVGKLMLDGIISRDMPIVIGAMLVITGNFIGVLLLLDILNGFIDPRVRV
jgi:peptide/nickel transport system permease protein